MFQLIQRQGSQRHLMALVNTDGSVAKAWPFESIDNNDHNGTESGVGNPMYGPLQIGKAEPVNLQFGNFGISAWPSDTGGTSHASSIDGSRADGTEIGSHNYSSCSSSPRLSEGRPAKEVLMFILCVALLYKLDAYILLLSRTLKYCQESIVTVNRLWVNISP